MPASILTIRYMALCVVLSMLTACGGGGGSGGDNSISSEGPKAHVANTNITAIAGETVALDGTTSTPATGLTYSWAQTGGTSVDLKGNAAATVSFIAPAADTEQALSFQLTVSNSAGNSTAQTVVTVQPFIVSITAGSTSVAGNQQVQLTANINGGSVNGFKWEVVEANGIDLTLDTPVAQNPTLHVGAVDADTSATLRVTVTNAHGQQTHADITLTLSATAPSTTALITSVSPSWLQAGDHTRISGSGFTDVTSLAINHQEIAADAYQILNDHEIDATIPNSLQSASTAYEVSVFYRGGQAKSSVTVAQEIKAVQVVAGSSHTCALLTDKTVRCWGYGGYGQLGDGRLSVGGGPPPNSNIPVIVRDINYAPVIAEAIATGSDHSCALLADKTVRCWGINNTGQLGDGSATSFSAVPVAVNDISDATAIAAGENHSCALLADHTVRCWGDNSYGQLGNGSTTFSTTAVTVSGINTAIAIAVGKKHTCALLTNRTLSCWGDNSVGQLSGELGDNTISTKPVSVIEDIDGTTLNNAIAIAASDNLSCTLLADQTVRCWGDNSLGQLGNGSAGDGAIPVSVKDIKNATAITVGSNHSCALLADKTLRCWGWNAYGQLGDGGKSDSLIPVRTKDISNATAITVGNNHSCALLADQSVRCWGYNVFGQLGDGSTPYRIDPTIVSGISTATNIAAGSSHSCTLLADQTVRCWGSNDAGQLGNDGASDSAIAVAVGGISKATAIAAGNRHTCALRTDQTVRCWGNNSYGQLGNGSTLRSTTPVTVGGISGATAIATGEDYTCALLTDKTVRCWGSNSSGQLGDGSTSYSDSAVPVTVSGISNAVAIAAGGRHTCALLADRTVRCWGYNGNGQLGDGSTLTTSTATPLIVSGISAVQAIATGYDYTCALLTDQTVRCWGYNNSGQLGDGSFSDSATPVGVNDITAAKAIAAGNNHSCVLLADASLRCWGGNSSGQLGNRSTELGAVPLAVPNLVGTKAIALGSGFSCALYGDGYVSCWGSNQFGQLGGRDVTPAIVLALP